MKDKETITKELCELIDRHYINLFMTSQSDIISVSEQSYKNGLSATKKIIKKYF